MAQITALAENILKYLEQHGSATSLELAKLWNEDHQKVVGSVKSLLCLGEVSELSFIFYNCLLSFNGLFIFSKVIEADLHSSNQWDLTEEGQMVAKDGSHEAQVYNAVPSSGSVTQAELMVHH